MRNNTAAAWKSCCAPAVWPDGRWYVSAAHNDADIDATLAAVRRILS